MKMEVLPQLSHLADSGAQHLKTTVSANLEGQMTFLESFPNSTFYGNKPVVQLKMNFRQALSLIYKDKSIFFNKVLCPPAIHLEGSAHGTTSNYTES